MAKESSEDSSYVKKSSRVTGIISIIFSVLTIIAISIPNPPTPESEGLGGAGVFVLKAGLMILGFAVSLILAVNSYYSNKKSKLWIVAFTCVIASVAIFAFAFKAHNGAL